VISVYFNCKQGIPRVYRYKSGEDSVPPAGPWIIKTRSYLQKRQKKQTSRAQSTTPSKVVEPVSGDRVEPEGQGGVDERLGEGYNRVDEVISKQDELLPVPPKLQKMRMRRKVGLQSFSKAPSIGWHKDDGAEDGERLTTGEGGDGEEEVEAEKEEHLEAEVPQSGDASDIDGRKKADDEAAMVDEAEEEDDDTDGQFVDFVQGVWDNSDRASIGMKLTRKCFGFSTTSPTQKVVG